MGSPYQLILLNLIHIQSVLSGSLQALIWARKGAAWRPAMIAWQVDQERQLKILLVLLKQLGGNYRALHSSMVWLSKIKGWLLGLCLCVMPLFLLKMSLGRMNKILADGFERASHQIAIADWAEWQAHSPINPPKALLELAVSRREWPSRWEGRVQFL